MKIPLHAAAALVVARRIRDELALINRQCPNGHGGHADDAIYCRICRSLLPTTERTADEDEQRLRRH